MTPKNTKVLDKPQPLPTRSALFKLPKVPSINLKSINNLSNDDPASSKAPHIHLSKEQGNIGDLPSSRSTISKKRKNKNKKKGSGSISVRKGSSRSVSKSNVSFTEEDSMSNGF